MPNSGNGYATEIAGQHPNKQGSPAQVICAYKEKAVGQLPHEFDVVQQDFHGGRLIKRYHHSPGEAGRPDQHWVRLIWDAHLNTKSAPGLQPTAVDIHVYDRTHDPNFPVKPLTSLELKFFNAIGHQAVSSTGHWSGQQYHISMIFAVNTPVKHSDMPFAFRLHNRAPGMTVCNKKHWKPHVQRTARVLFVSRA